MNFIIQNVSYHQNVLECVYIEHDFKHNCNIASIGSNSVKYIYISLNICISKIKCFVSF